MRHKLPTGMAFFRLSTGLFWRLLLLALPLSACAPKLGDGCERTAECSVNGDRTCDRSQPGGYCTIPDCEANSCPDDGACVRFQPDEPRLSRAWCMASCGNTKDCDRDRYVCRNADQLNAYDAPEQNEMMESFMVPPLPRVAEVLDKDPNRKFCVVDSKD
jgi:hypothetical protein